jgi:hypothetical protein
MDAPASGAAFRAGAIFAGPVAASRMKTALF